MLAFLDNGIVQSVLAAIIFAGLVWVVKFIQFRRDEQKICQFIHNSSDTFRSTEAIAAETHLEMDRIRLVASRSQKIRRNTKQKESWCSTK